MKDGLEIRFGAGRDAFIGLVRAEALLSGSPRLIALPTRSADALDPLEPSEVSAAVSRALRDVANSTGVSIAVDAIEYVPDDAPHYDLIYTVARHIAMRLAADEEFPTSR